ncbi:hypothetical protein HPV03_004339 [Salmonella enterica]|nr:hypothetical protein [Salmonella enterica]EHC7479299.1 hypothetical protein [Salmonella enterica subsp. enterica serovar Chomedey]HCJ1013142.1 hypothetical protein [Salmonella enterica]
MELRWRKITTTPDRSGNAARPVSVRARHTGSGQWISPRHMNAEQRDIIYEGEGNTGESDDVHTQTYRPLCRTGETSLTLILRQL